MLLGAYDVLMAIGETTVWTVEARDQLLRLYREWGRPEDAKPYERRPDSTNLTDRPG